MNKINIGWWADEAYDFLNLLIGVIVLVPFVIVILIISGVGIIGLSRSSSFNPSISLQGRRMTGTNLSLSESEIRRKTLEENKC
jgi:hypothetical protein